MRAGASEIEKYFFRHLPPSINIGTASDRYRGWSGQIYSEELYAGRTVSRANRVGKNRFREEAFPVDCVREYFRHFRILELDYTFYAPLIMHGVRTPCAGLLERYAQFMRPEDRVFLKAPRIFFVPKLRRGKGYVRNASYLDSEAFLEQFYGPALALLGPRLKGVIFEQEYQRCGERAPAGRFARELDAFFGSLPPEGGYHVELRTEAYLREPVFDMLRANGVGHVLSHWTWLPDLKRQFALASERFFAAGGNSVIRLMTPLGVRYEDAYAKAFPFDRLIGEMLQPRMISHTVDLLRTGIERGIEMNVIVNNRSGGNAPRIARELARRFLELEKSETVR